MPQKGIESCLEKVRFKWRRKTLNISEERIEPAREFQIVGAAAWKEREPKIGLLRGRLLRGNCKRLEEGHLAHARAGR